MSAHRITIVARDKGKPAMDWSASATARQPLAFVDSVRALRFALGTAVLDVGLDISRVIVDRVGAGDDFLDLLAALPGEFAGDVLLVRDDGTGILSATGRGGDRMLYALMAHDVRFYLETHDLVLSRVAMELTA
ncbi:MAG TPA: hypothetical protein VEO54_16505 [Thermoanaerobaculia bacterium]|nr:hypothetical protein [Thermoanaerobaculia bacterium]